MIIKGKKHAKSLMQVLPLCLLLCACTNVANGFGGQGESATGNGEAVSSTMEGSGNGKEADGNLGADIVGYIVNAQNDASLFFDDETVFRDIDDGRELAGILNEVVAGGQFYPVKAKETRNEFTISAMTKKGSYEIRKVNIDGQSALRIGNTYYHYDERIDRFAPGDALTDDVIGRLLSQSVQCEEPVDDMDYVALGEKLVYSFLDTLKTEEGRYRLEKYTPDYSTLEARGYVGNGIEFCVAVYFKTDIEVNSSAFYCEGGYDTFYHYYHGPMVYVRCHYENGQCEVVDYDDAFLADLTEDLNGISAGTGPYPTFWEFYDDTENLEKLMKEVSMPSQAEYAVAGSPIMLADGQIGYVIIAPRNGAMWEQEGKSYGVFDNYYGTMKKATYSSPIDYKDGSGACVEQYGSSFDLIWDDYNSDGNPEFAIKQDAEDEDENGARYEVRCMSNDMTPRDSRFDFYMAGRHEECIHLQRTDKGVVIWDLVDGVMTPNQSVDDFRMYSRRYYLPGNMRGYTDEQEIQCFFWNNTDREVSTDSTYHVERKDGNQWVKVSGDRKIASVKCPAYRDVTLTFDISDIQRTNGEYRIVLGKQVCGGFYIRGDRVSAQILQDETTVTIVNDGTASLRIYDLCWIKDGEVVGKIENVGGRSFGVIPAGSKKTIAISPLATFDGMYSVRADVGMILESEPVEYRYVRYFGDAQVSEQDGKLVLTVDVLSDVTGNASVECFTENDWKATCYKLDDLDLKAGKQEIIFIDSLGLDINSEEYEKYYQEAIEWLLAALQSGELDQLSEEEREAYKRVMEMSKEEFYYYITGVIPLETIVTTPLRIKIADEYIYVNMPR